MRICHVITRLIIGGAQENTLLSCEGLHDRGHEVLLLAGPDSGPEGSLWDRANGYGYQTELLSSLHRAVRPICEVRALLQLRRAYAGFAPDIIHTHSSKAGILGRLASGGFAGAKVVHTIHGMSFNRTQSWCAWRFYRLLERRAARRTDKIISVADAMTTQAVEAGVAQRHKFETVYSAMQTEWFKPRADQRVRVRKNWGVEERHVVVGTVARLFRNKGYEQLIPAMVRAIRDHDELRFVWVGDGANRDQYVHKLEALGIRDRVILTGLLPPRDVATVMQGFDILAHCSQWEGLPRAVSQAQLLEVPVVCFDNDGAPEVVEDKATGMLVSFNDIEGLADAVAELAGHPEDRRRMGRAGRRRCLQMFDHVRMVDQLERIYAELTQRGKS